MFTVITCPASVHLTLSATCGHCSIGGNIVHQLDSFYTLYCLQPVNTVPLVGTLDSFYTLQCLQPVNTVPLAGTLFINWIVFIPYTVCNL